MFVKNVTKNVTGISDLGIVSVISYYQNTHGHGQVLTASVTAKLPTNTVLNHMNLILW